ncbi:MAG: helix-turn-helix transcriptional regulator [Paludibacteraceae bacterium]|nr:helix-turn-helix transcriptional regulator [Paludibacteraceae bacterium]
MNSYISSIQYLGIMVQGGNIFYFLINAIFLFFIMPKLQPKRNAAAAAIHNSLGWLLLVYVANYSLWIVPELFQPQCGYYRIGNVYPNYKTLMEYMDLAVLPLSMVFGSTVLLGKMPPKWIGPAILLPYLIYSLNDIFEILPFKLYTFAYISTIIVVIAQLAWYGFFIRKFDKKLMENCSNIDRRSIKWVFWTLVPLLVLTILYIPLNMMTNVDEWMVLYDFLTLLIITGIVGHSLSHKVDEMTIELISEQIEEMEIKGDGGKKDVDANEPESVDAAPSANIDAETGEQKSQADESSASTDNAKAQTSSSLSSKFMDFDDVFKKLEEEKFYLDTEVNIDWISSKLGTNRHYVSDYLNRVKHVSFYEYVNTLRLIYAERLLKEGKEKLADIAFICGFNSDHTFRRLFKEKYGCTPLQYQKSA